jgi:curved DNA-binding protein CbpA
MDPRLRLRIEIETMHELLPSLDYYQLLGVQMGCAQADVDAAFRNEGRRLHPDRVVAGAPAEFRSVANSVFKAVNDAYRVLRDPDARGHYDNELRAGRLTMDAEARKAAEAEAAARNDPAKAARTEKGGKFWKLALGSFAEKDYNGCVMNIQFALSFEPDNEVFKEWQTKARALKEEGKKDKATSNAYKIRI